MRVFLVLWLACLASVFAEPNLIQTGYHEHIGIPEAARIKAAEEQMAKDVAITQEQNRIVGGFVAPPHEHPYFAGLLINLLDISGISVCGSTVLSANRLVTAAHCWFDGRYQAWQFTVVLGTLTLFSGGTRITTQQVIPFNTFNPATLTHDIAIIYLPTNIQFSSSIAPVSLPDGIELFLTFEDQTGVAVGFGRTSDQQSGISTSAVVHHMGARIVSSFECQAYYGFGVTEFNICTDGQGGRGICGGDSGGPLLVNFSGRIVLVGVTSFSATSCQMGFPSGYTRVTSYINFIRQHL